MSREVRMVPKGWQHPQNARGFIPLLAGTFSQRAQEWDEEARRWKLGQVRDYSKDVVAWTKREASYKGMTFEEYSGERPTPDQYMPEFEPGTATWYMMYESTSEGTPISPAFETPEELARWLADNNASAFADQGATYEQWLKMIKAGWAPSAVYTEGAGLQSGVAFQGKDEK